VTAHILQTLLQASAAFVVGSRYKLQPSNSNSKCWLEENFAIKASATKGGPSVRGHPPDRRGLSCLPVGPQTRCGSALLAATIAPNLGQPVCRPQRGVDRLAERALLPLSPLRLSLWSTINCSTRRGKGGKVQETPPTSSHS
jgi:hypothetical protein